MDRWQSTREIEQQYLTAYPGHTHAELGAAFRPDLDRKHGAWWSQNFARALGIRRDQRADLTKSEIPKGPHRPASTIDDLPGGAIFGDTIRFGFITDTHLCSIYAREDVLHDAYRTFEAEGIRTVLHAGNWCEGQSRVNQFELLKTGFDPQIQYVVDNHPQVPGITTFFVDGDDHEGWWRKEFGIEPGKRLEQEAKEDGRDDLVYLGYVEHDFILPGSGGERTMKVMHPGGGSAKSISLTPQNVVEAFDDGEKPAVLLIGHYHKAEFIPAFRNVSVIQGGCMQEQSVWARKMKIIPHIGYWLIEMRLNDDGSVARLKPEWFAGKKLGKRNPVFSTRRREARQLCP